MTEESKWKRRLERERNARKQAEDLLEKKALELWEANESLKKFSEDLQHTVDMRSADLAQALEQEVEANKAKSEFVSMISHEMRTPLNAIIGFSEVLTDQERAKTLSAEQTQSYLENIFTSSKGLLSLINNILDMAKIEAGKLELESLEFDHNKQIQQLVDTHTITAANKNIPIALHLDENLPKMLRGDPSRLSQVLNNLMSNAIKFTNKGKVTLNVSMGELLDSGDLDVLYEVRDQGIGMTDVVMERLFQPFTQADNSMSRKYGGTGLGLTISRQLCEAMGGKIWVESEEHRGSSFFFKVRYQRVDQSEEQTAPKAERKVDRLKGYAILLVEDDLINQELAKYLLESEGAALDVASNGLEAVDAVQQKDFDLVLMDLQMPICDGYTATLKIRESRPKDTLAIVAMTANAASDVRARCLEVGMTDFLTKPFIIEDLLKTIETHCAVSKANSSVARDQSQDPMGVDAHAETYVKQIDVNKALTQLHGNRHLYGRVLSQFKQCCMDGVYKLDPQRLLQDKLNSLRLVYTIKRLSHNVGAYSLSDLLEKIESAVNEDKQDALVSLVEQYSLLLKDIEKEITRIDLSEVST